MSAAVAAWESQRARASVSARGLMTTEAGRITDREQPGRGVEPPGARGHGVEPAGARGHGEGARGHGGAVRGPGTEDARVHRHGCEPAPVTTPPRPDGPSLEVAISAAWRELLAGRTARCPLCSGPLKPRYGAHATPVGGRCVICATTLE